MFHQFMTLKIPNFANLLQDNIALILFDVETNERQFLT